MKKSVVFIIIMLLVFPSILAFSWDSFINGITGRASTSNTNVSIQVLVPVPNLTIVHPTNTTYSDNSSLSLNFTAQYATIIWYHIDSNANVTITGNTTFNVSEGGHILFLYANNTDQNMSRVNVSFNVNTSADETTGSGSSSGGGGGMSSKTVPNEPKKKTPVIEEESDKEVVPEPELETPQQQSCKSWSECQADYTLEDVVAGTILLIGEKYCIDDPSTKISCNPQKEISVKKSEKCFKEFYDVYDENSNLVSKIEIKNEDIKIVNIDFAIDNAGYCNYCYDNEKNFDEENVDCGGSCAPCIETAQDIDPSIKPFPEFLPKYCEFPYLLTFLLIINLLIFLKFIKFNFYKNFLMKRMHFFAGHVEIKENLMRIIGIILSSLMFLLSITFMILLPSCWIYYVLFLCISLIMFLMYNIEKLKILFVKKI